MLDIGINSGDIYPKDVQSLDYLPQGDILVTGAAGFIGMHICEGLLRGARSVVALDSLNSYYDVSLKHARLDKLRRVAEESGAKFSFYHGDIVDSAFLSGVFDEHKFSLVLHMAAQAGVRYSLEAPLSYIQSNVVGFTTLLEFCRKTQVGHFVYASSSSVYGLNRDFPYSEEASIAHPVSLYAATKKSNELLAHSYSHLYGLPTTGLRFFTVYGPWGRPDMSPMLFTKALIAGEPIRVFNEGKMERDFTYVDDIVRGVFAVAAHPPAGDATWDPCHPLPSSSRAPYKIYNIGCGRPVPLERFIDVLSSLLGLEAKRDYLPMQPGDVVSTHADITALKRDTGYSPSVTLEQGLVEFVRWYRSYYRV